MRRALVAGMVLCSSVAFASTPVKKTDASLATVNGESVTVRNLVDQFTARHGGHAKFLGGNAEARSFLNIIIDEKLLLQEAYDIGLDQDPAVQAAVAEYEKSETVKYLINAEIDRKAEPSKDDVRAVWDSSMNFFLQVRQIAVESRQEAEEIRAGLLQGADFESLARDCSRLDTRLNGGHLLVNWGQFDPEWERVVFALEPGEISPVIPTRNGFEVVIVDSRIDATRPELAKIGSQIEGALRLRRSEELKRAFSQQLWTNYHVVLQAVDRTPSSLAVLLRTSPETVIATWDGGGKLVLKDALTAEKLRTWADLPPVRAQYEIDSQIRAVVNEPLVALEAKARKIAVVPEVAESIEKYRDRMAESLLFRDHIYKEIVISADDKAKYYETHKGDFEEPEQRHVAHIMVSTEAEATAVHAKLAGGAVFEDVARHASRDFATAMSGGDLGWVTADKVPDGLRDVLRLAAGEFSKPLKSKTAWHIIKVLEVKPKRTLTPAEAAPKVEKAVREQKQSEARAFWVKKLRAAAKIESDDAAIAAFVKANEFTGDAPSPQHQTQ